MGRTYKDSRYGSDADVQAQRKARRDAERIEVDRIMLARLEQSDATIAVALGEASGL